MADRVLQGNEYASKYARTTQVYKATHDGVGNRLPFRYRSFISFSYGERIIEDFGLLATIDGDRLERDVYAKFNDVTENHETLDGQIYWGTHFTNNELNLTLSTDGITARQLDDFKQWFAPGKIRELILMEHPNRVIMARVSEPPQISMLPFVTTATTKILGENYTTEVTLFKGDISLSFIMDEPFWHAKYNIIHPFIPKGGANSIINLKDNPETIKNLLVREFKNKNRKLYIEYIKDNLTRYCSVNVENMEISEMGYWEIEAELDDGSKSSFAYPAQNKNRIPKEWDKEGESIPIITAMYGGVFTNLFGRDSESYDKTDEDAEKDYMKIILEDNIPHLRMIQDNILLGEDTGAAIDVESRVFNNSSNVVNGLEPGLGAHVLYYGYVAYDIASWIENVKIYDGQPQYLFYSGTAPSKPTLQFTFSPTFDANGYINLPRNKYTYPKSDYNYIAFDEHKFYFTTPTLLSGYNQAIDIVKKFKIGQPFNDLINYLRENINEYHARAWAIFCARSLENNNNYVNSETSAVTEDFKNEFINRMKYLICDNNDVPTSVNCFFDSKHGTATVTYAYIREANINPATISNINDIKNMLNSLTYKCVQNAGDMVKSDYLIIEGRNYPSFNGYITKEECHILTTNFNEENPLTGLLVTFQNMYY